MQSPIAPGGLQFRAKQRQGWMGGLNTRHQVTSNQMTHSLRNPLLLYMTDLSMRLAKVEDWWGQPVHLLRLSFCFLDSEMKEEV